MKIHLQRVRREPFRFAETLEVSAELLERDEVVALGPVSWSGKVVWADPGYYLTGRLEYEQTLSCDRCLEPITERRRSDVEVLLLVDEPRPMDGEHELSEEDLGILHLDDEVFDTWALVVEQLQLDVPMKPVCRPDCKGLCPVCGTDRNAGDCGCDTRTVDPRWAALEKLRPEN